MNRKVDLLDQVPQEKKIFLDDVVDALCLIPGMVAVVLGGSYARGTYHPHSDLDVGLYYAETNPFPWLKFVASPLIFRQARCRS